MFETIRKKFSGGYDILEYLYMCETCNVKHWSASKNLYMSCPRCRSKKIHSKMRLAV